MVPPLTSVMMKSETAVPASVAVLRHLMLFVPVPQNYLLHELHYLIFHNLLTLPRHFTTFVKIELS